MQSDSPQIRRLNSDNAIAKINNQYKALEIQGFRCSAYDSVTGTVFRGEGKVFSSRNSMIIASDSRTGKTKGEYTITTFAKILTASLHHYITACTRVYSGLVCKTVILQPISNWLFEATKCQTST